MSSEAYERERQNNTLLSELAGKVTALRGVTVDIYDSARNHDMIDQNNEAFTSFAGSLRGSATRLTRMAQSGNKVAVLKLAGILIAIVVSLYWVLRWIF